MAQIVWTGAADISASEAWLSFGSRYCNVERATLVRLIGRPVSSVEDEHVRELAALRAVCGQQVEMPRRLPGMRAGGIV